MFEGDPTGGPAGGRIGALDGLRALAVIAVLLFHADLGAVSGGFLGVSVFFTLSGFLITSLLVEELRRSGTVALRAFYGRRARRLVPAAYLCIGVVVALGVCWGATQRRDLPGDAVAAVANVANWRFAFAARTYQDLFIGSPSPLAHFWSLAIEEQCYLVLPLVAWWALRTGGRRRLGALLVLLTGGSLVATLLTSDTNLVYHGTHTRAAELLIGALLALAAAGRRPSPRLAVAASSIGLVGLVVLVMVTDMRSQWLYRGGFVVVALMSAATVFGLTGEHAVSRAVGWAPLQFVGRRSYGVYLYHWPVFLLLAADRLGIDGVGLLAVRLVVTAAITEVSYRWLEQPIRTRAVLAAPRRATVALGGAAVAVLAAALVVVPAPHFTATEQLLAQGDDGPIVFGDEPSATTGVTVATSVSGGATAAPLVQRLSPPPVVLVVGSDAGVVPMLQAAQYEVVDGTQPHCPIVPGVAVRFPDGTVLDTQSCEPVIPRWRRLLDRHRPDVVVIATGALDTGIVRRAEDAPTFPADDDVTALAQRLDAVSGGMREAVDVLRSADVPIVLLDTAEPDAIFDQWPQFAVAAQPALQMHRSAQRAALAVKGAIDARAAGGSSADGEVSAAPTRVLVLGDSTSLDVAKALSDGGDGRITVAWAGQSGCPFVDAVRFRTAADQPPSDLSCRPFDEVVPAMVASFQPDAVLVVCGPVELGLQQYAGIDGFHRAGDQVFTDRHDAAMRHLLDVVAPRSVLVADAPPIRAGWASPEQASPQRLAAWNAQVQRWDGLPGVVAVPYAAELLAYEDVHGNIRSDGVHPDLAPLTELARTRLVDLVLDAARGER